MAEKLESFPFRGVSKYHWDTWLDGSIWKITQGKDFMTSPGSIRCSVIAAAKRRGLQVITHVNKNEVVFQVKIKPD